MQSTTILFIILAVAISLYLAYFQYYFKVKNKVKITPVLFFLKAFSVFLLLLLLINPKVEKTIINTIKPVLSVLVDDSKSVTFFNENQNVENFIGQLQHKDLKNKFEIQKFNFGEDLHILDSLTFSKNQSNISAAIQGVNILQKDKISPIILISDGNQTIGQDYEFLSSKLPVYPVVIGDTVKYVDLNIGQLNVNRYSYIKNKFPVEVIINYEGDKNVIAQFSIFSKGKTVIRKTVSFSSDKNSATIITNLTSIKEGLQYYTASISKLNNEKNTKNNSKNFYVEVIDEQTKVLLLTSVLHPDLGALKKAIESNKQRTVEIINIDNFKNDIKDYQLVVLYQPNNKFNKVLTSIKKNNDNYLLITGTNSDWGFINQQEIGVRKNAINQSEYYATNYNDSFLTFQQDDIGFNNYPPLKDKFGEVSLNKEHQTLLYQNINGIQTQQPMLSTFDVNNQKYGILFGEGIWKWRAASYLNSNSFEEFDKFIGNLVQYLASNKKRKRLEVNSESLYPANSSINISAFYTDKNYQFDARASLEITITNVETKELIKVPFSLINNSFQTEIENLSSGNYDFKVSVLGQNIKESGRFKITDYQIEEQFLNANVIKLQKLANKTGGKLFYKNQVKELQKELLENESFYTVQKSSTIQQNLIDWKWVLCLAIILFTIEWFLRKYHGKI